MTIVAGFILLIIIAIVFRKNNLNNRRSRGETILDNDEQFLNSNNMHTSIHSDEYHRSYDDALNHQINSGHSHHTTNVTPDLHHHTHTHWHSESISNDPVGGNDSISDTTIHGTGGSSSNLD